MSLDIPSPRMGLDWWALLENTPDTSISYLVFSGHAKYLLHQQHNNVRCDTEGTLEQVPRNRLSSFPSTVYIRTLCSSVVSCESIHTLFIHVHHIIWLEQDCISQFQLLISFIFTAPKNVNWMYYSQHSHTWAAVYSPLPVYRLACRKRCCSAAFDYDNIACCPVTTRRHRIPCHWGLNVRRAVVDEHPSCCFIFPSYFVGMIWYWSRAFFFQKSDAAKRNSMPCLKDVYVCILFSR